MSHNGKKVSDGDYLVLDQGDIAYFYKVENGKPKVFANWMIASLGLIDYEEHHKEAMQMYSSQASRNQQEEFYKEITGVTVNDLEEVSPKMKYYLDLIQSNGKGHMFLTGSLEEPTEDDDEDE